MTAHLEGQAFRETALTAGATSQASPEPWDDSTGPPPPSDESVAVITLVGIGADGWRGLTSSPTALTRKAGVVLGGQRQLDLLRRP